MFSVVVQAQEKLGPVDMLVNCAGTSISGKFEDVEVDRFKVGTWSWPLCCLINHCFSCHGSALRILNGLYEPLL